MKLLGSLVIFYSSVAAALAADPTLPYGLRTRSYSGYSTTAHGDIRTVGMAGATVGLADTFIAAINNPAGLAMTLDNADSHYTENFIHDDHVQDYSSLLQTTSYGAAAAFYPWAYSMGYISPYRENQSYVARGKPEEPVELDIITREVHLSAARALHKNRISLGASLTLGQGSISNTYGSTAADNRHYTDFAASGTLGAMFQFPERILAGISYTLPTTYHFDPSRDMAPGLPGFSQNIDVPGTFAVGLGWIPNRFFRLDFTTLFVQTTRRAAILRDDSVPVGAHPTVQPRLGIAYVFAEYQSFKGTVFAGSYFEQSRVEDVASRFHKTVGMELKPWIFTVGWGIDSATGYKNYLVSAGIDIFKVTALLEITPTPWKPEPRQMGPNPFALSDEGLARPLVADWQQRGPDLDPIKAGLAIPHKLQKKVKQTGEALQDLIR